MEGGKTANYWPGFVDALTNVVIAMVFVIVVLAIALSFAAQLMGKKIAEQVIAQHDKAAAVSASAAASARSVAGVTAPSTVAAVASGPQHEGAVRAPITVARIPVRGNESATHAEGGALRTAPNSLQLDFDSTALSLDGAAADHLRTALAATRADPAVARLQIVGSGPSIELSENQRSAYVRVMGVRNQLIDQGWPPAHLSVRIDTKSRAPSPTVTISLITP